MNTAGEHNRSKRPFPGRELKLARADILHKTARRKAPTWLVLLVAVLSGCGRAKSYLTVETMALPDVPHTILLRWQPSPRAKFYNVHRSARPGGPFRKIGTSNTASFLDFPVSEPGTLYYSVTAANDYGESEPSSRLTVSLR